MFPVQQGATWPAQLWPPRLGIKLLEGAPSTEKWGKGVYFRMASGKIGVISLVFAQWVERAQRGHINRTTPVLTDCRPDFRGTFRNRLTASCRRGRLKEWSLDTVELCRSDNSSLDWSLRL